MKTLTEEERYAYLIPPSAGTKIIKKCNAISGKYPITLKCLQITFVN